MRVGCRGQVSDWAETVDVFAISDRELELWTLYGCPVSERGADRANWKFESGLVIRWLVLFGAYLAERGLIARDQVEFGHVLERIESRI